MPLADLAAVKAFRAITGTADDTALTQVLGAVEEAVARYLRRPVLERTALDEFYDGDGRHDFIVLRTFPIQAIATVTLDGEVLAVGDFATEAFGNTNDGVLFYQPDGEPAAWPCDRRNIRVQYDGGYEPVPADLAEAVIIQTWFVFERRSRLGNRQVAGVDGGSTTYLVDAFAPDVRSMLEGFRAVNF